MSIDETIEQYLMWKSTYATAASKSYGVRLKHFKAYLTHNGQICRELASISGNDIIQYHHKMATQWEYSHSTIAFSAYILKDFFKFWNGRGETTINPLEIKAMKYVSPQRTVVTQADYEEMCECLKKDDFSDVTKLLVISILWDTGMRVSELCDIKLSDLGEPNKDGIRSCQVRTRKTMRYNQVAWSKETDHILKTYLGVRLCLAPSSPYLLIAPLRPTNKKLTTKSVQRWVKEICERSMFEKEITPHCFRHGKAHHMLDNGANVRDVQAILRHVNPESSFHYMTLNTTRFLQTAAQHL